MKNAIVPIFGVFALLFIVHAFTFGQSSTPLAANGRLQVINRQLCNEAGTPIQLRGMSSHGLHWFDQCYTSSALQTLANDWGADVFRAAMYVDEGGYINNKVGLRNKVNQLVDWSAQFGMYCIIDWHILNPGDPNLHTADAIEFFQLMAQQHAGKKHVIYEICNEPNGVSWSSVKSYAEQVIPAIRQYDPDAIILVGTPSWSGSPGDVRSNPLTGPNAHNIMYTFHFYAGSHYTQSYIDDVIKTVPLFVSEWGTSNYSGNGGNDYTNAQNWVSFMGGNNSSGMKISWCNWSYCDKDESSAALLPGVCGANGWNNTSTSGTWVKDKILNPADNFGPPTPFVAITSPTNNSTVTIGTNLTINASVGNATATVVEFYDGATKLGEDATAPYTLTLSNVQAGTYTFTAKALLASGGPLTSSLVQVTAIPAPNQPPTVSLTSPANGTTFTAPATITISANAADSDGSVAKVEFYNGSTKLGEDTSAPYSFDWSNVASGAYTLSAKVTDNQNSVATSGSVTVYVNSPGNPSADIISPDCVSINEVKVFELNSINLPNANSFSWWCTGSTQSITAVSGQPSKVNINFGANFSGGQVCVGVNYSAAPWYKQFCKTVTLCTGQPPVVNQAPSVSVTAPSSNAMFQAPASISLAATASDADGSITKVEFYNGTTKLGEDATSPYEFSWTNVVAGSYSLTAKATDNQGTTTTSAAVSVTVNAPVVNQAPSVSVTAPSNNATFLAPASISLAATASDADGSIAKVEFYNGTTKLGEDATSPYTFSWTNVAAGSYSLTAKATDNQGATTTSAAVSVTVTNPPTSTADIIGDDCAAVNSIKTFELNVANRANATNYSWWSTGSVQSIAPTSGQPYKVTINVGQWFTGGQVCLGVSYSASPWYKQYCKTVSVCAAARVAAEELPEIASFSLYPNPTQNDFTWVSDKNVEVLKVYDVLGLERVGLEKITRGTKVSFGEKLSTGIYLIRVQYEDRTQLTLKGIKQ
ncbi:MAG: cellulase family glycosylhydrolase [Bacteroidetes bacterium]|nr:cellulase family glycosylhydrolase [Bacteroidota bacterium]